VVTPDEMADKLREEAAAFFSTHPEAIAFETTAHGIRARVVPWEGARIGLRVLMWNQGEDRRKDPTYDSDQPAGDRKRATKARVSTVTRERAREIIQQVTRRTPTSEVEVVPVAEGWVFRAGFGDELHYYLFEGAGSTSEQDWAQRLQEIYPES
jgi:hypothetical protein